MSTGKDKDFDYQEHMKNNAPKVEKILRGTQGREVRRAKAKERITIRIDQDTLERFKELAPEGQGYQSLMNEALKDWLNAQGVKELIREELEAMTEKVVLTVRATRVTSLKS